MLDALDKRLITALSRDLPLTSQPYQQVAQELGISMAEVINRLQKLRQKGVLRKLGAVVGHRQLGYKANALVAGIVPETRLETVGQQLARHPAVTHCYARPAQPGWPYNLYFMLHAFNRQLCQAMADELMLAAGICQYRLFFSTKEWKKTTMIYTFK